MNDVDEFPAHQAWADEVEQILAFLEVQGQLNRLLPRLRAKERDAALAEARAGFYFDQKGFRILRWEPVAVPEAPGDLELAWLDTEPVFIEVKCPRWEGELGRKEIQTGRTRRPKYINAEGRMIDPIERVTYVLSKALPKFDGTRVNLVVVVDDLFVSPLDLPREFVVGRLAAELTNPVYAAVSGVLLLNPVLYEQVVEYRVLFTPGLGRTLPDAARGGLLAESTPPKTPC